jgi:hypothetical protein
MERTEMSETKINDGGPAFPVPLNENERYVGPGSELGMTLRDWFAGQALGGIAANASIAAFHLCAQEAYEFADAMLAARARGEG